jgi:hypothetical protein
VLIQVPCHKLAWILHSSFDLVSLSSSGYWFSRSFHDPVLCSFTTEFVSIAGETPGNPKSFAQKKEGSSGYSHP